MNEFSFGDGLFVCSVLLVVSMSIAAGVWVFVHIKEDTKPKASFTELMMQERSCGLEPKASDYQ
jgi:hypothetical protein